MNKKGDMFDIFVLLIVSFIIFLFFAGWIYGFNLFTSRMLEITSTTDSFNITSATEQTFSQINVALPTLRWVALVIVIAMMMSILVSNFLVKAHPVFFIVYVLITAVAIVFSVYLSNAYESILTATNPLTATLQSFTAMDHIFLNLPIWTTIIGIAGAMFLFIGIIVDREQGGSVI
jgi:hypothetical protein